MLALLLAAESESAALDTPRNTTRSFHLAPLCSLCTLSLCVAASLLLCALHGTDGNRWDSSLLKELDGGDPEADDNRALISTAVRTCKTAGR